jgi:hypothetical protein
MTRAGKQMARGCDWSYPCPISGGGSTGDAVGERRRRDRSSTAEVAESSAREQAGMGNVLHTGLLGTLGEVLDGPLGLENRRRGEFGEGCPAATAGARAPASRRLGQVDPCACMLYWFVGKDQAHSKGVVNTRSGKLTMWHPWRTAAARGRARKDGAALLYPGVRRWVCYLRVKVTKSRYGPWHERSTARCGWRRRAACTPARGWLGGAAWVRQLCGLWVRGTWHHGSGPGRRFHGAWTGRQKPASACGPSGAAERPVC